MKRLLTLAAPVVFVLLWSTGFVGARYGLPYAPPFALLAIRLIIAAAVLALLAALWRSTWPKAASDYRRSAVIGVLLHAGYLGGVFVAIGLGLPVSVTALVVCLQPVLVAVFAGPALGENLVQRQWLGIALGLVGAITVLTPGLMQQGNPSDYAPVAVLAAVVALISSSVATVLQKKYGASISLLPGTAVQYAAAAILLAVLALLTEDIIINWTPTFIGALTWLVLALSIGAVLLMFWLLRIGTATGVSSLYYLVPPVTLFEAYLLFGEQLSALSLGGFALATVGVALVRRRELANSR
ncbi:MAG: DMT family transporter [Actinomycetota bacterium]|nr:DMT family transporter [Actinomycetota bacterium]